MTYQPPPPTRPFLSLLARAAGASVISVGLGLAAWLAGDLLLSGFREIPKTEGAGGQLFLIGYLAIPFAAIWSAIRAIGFYVGGDPERARALAWTTAAFTCLALAHLLQPR
jgi:hypothetical protein